MKQLILTAAAFLTALGLNAASNISAVSQRMIDSTIVVPESCEVDTKKMLENWYLNNYAVIDPAADKRTAVEVTDEVLIERLSKMPTVIEMPFNSVVKRYIELYSLKRRQLVENMLGLGLYYMPIFEAALDRYGMPLELRYLPIVESALNPNAVSRVGATGLWQFMLPTARGLNLEVNSLVDERRDPYASSDAAARYLKELHNTFGNWSLAIAAYNCGPGNINKAMRRAGGNGKDFWDIYPYLPEETRGYVPAFIAVNYIMNYYPEHNISPALARRPVVTDTVQVCRRVFFDQISEVLNIPKEEIRALNPQYREDNIPGDIRPYSLVLPSLQSLAYVVNEDSIVNHRAAEFARRRVVEPASAISSSSVTGSDSKGEYITEEIVQYYKVRKGDNLSKIANKYGTTIDAIQKANKLRSRNVKIGQTLKIVTYRKRYVEKPAPVVEAKPDSVPVTETPVVATPEPVADSEEEAIIEAADQEQPGNMAVDEDDEVDVTEIEISDEEAETPDQPEAGQQTAAQPQEQPTTESKAVAEAMNRSQKAETAKAQPASKPSYQTTHTVRRGENLFKISQRYGVTIEAIQKANNLKGTGIQVGQRLKIPAK